MGTYSSTVEGNITISIIRSPQSSAFEDTKSDIIGFEIIDNGVGLIQIIINHFKF